MGKIGVLYLVDFPPLWYIITLVRLTVSSIGLLDTTIIGDILSLSIDPAKVEA